MEHIQRYVTIKTCPESGQGRCSGMEFFCQQCDECWCVDHGQPIFNPRGHRRGFICKRCAAPPPSPEEAKP